MPYLYAHALHALRAQAAFVKPIQEITSAHQDAFLLGAYGPDMYFYDRLPSPLFEKQQKPLSNRLHDCDASLLFSRLFPLCCKDDRAFAYGLGMLCHFALDHTVHGYVESRYTGNDHTRFEMRMDLPIRDRSGDARLYVSPCELYAADRAVRLAETIHTSLFSELFSLNTAGVFQRSYYKWKRVARLAYDPSGRKLRFLRGVERRLDKSGELTGFLLTYDGQDRRDLFNEAHDRWAAPWDVERVRSESYFELFDQAVSEAVRLADAAAGDRQWNIFDEAIGMIGHRCMNGKSFPVHT